MNCPERRVRRVWLWLIPAAVLTAVLAGAQALPGLRARAATTAPGGGAAAKETVELAGESVEYDVTRRVSVVTGGPGAPATLVSGKLTLSGARLEYSEENGLVKVEGGVRLEQTAPDQVVVTARTLTADLKARTAQLSGEVRLASGKAVATSATAFFQGKERQVTLTGNPEVRSDGNILTGQEIVFLLAEQKLKARGGSRVTVPSVPGGQGGE
jgi:lipopolysaccharide export system protein LptA